MRRPASVLKYCSLAIGVAAVFGVALPLLPASHGSAHEGGYLEFNGPGSGYLEVPDNVALNPIGAITVEAWIYLNSYAGWGQDPNFTDCPMLVGKNWSESYALALGCGGDVMDSFINGIEYFEDTPTVPLNTWTHVAMTYDGATRTNYQDGIPITQATDPEGPIGDTADPLRIGDDVNWDRSPDGRIDDVRIWNVARTQPEILDTMGYVDPATPGLVADWTFDDESTVDEACGLVGTLHGDALVAPDGTTPRPTPAPGTPKCLGQPTPTPSPTPTGGPTATPFNGPPRPGDVDCNGSVTVADGGGLLRTLAGPFTSHIGILVPFCNDGGAMVDGRPARDDATCDGLVDVVDVLAIFKYAAGVSDLAVSCPSFSPTPTPSVTPI